jgi:hypothetical protein
VHGQRSKREHNSFRVALVCSVSSCSVKMGLDLLLGVERGRTLSTSTRYDSDTLLEQVEFGLERS